MAWYARPAGELAGNCCTQGPVAVPVVPLEPPLVPEVEPELLPLEVEPEPALVELVPVELEPVLVLVELVLVELVLVLVEPELAPVELVPLVPVVEVELPELVLPVVESWGQSQSPATTGEQATVPPQSALEAQVAMLSQKGELPSQVLHRPLAQSLSAAHVEQIGRPPPPVEVLPVEPLDPVLPLELPEAPVAPDELPALVEEPEVLPEPVGEPEVEVAPELEVLSEPVLPPPEVVTQAPLAQPAGQVESR